MNSLFQQLNGNQQQSHSLPSNIKQMVQMFKMNPKTYIEQQINNNPQFKSILQASNGNYEQAFKMMCKQMNVDPNEIISMLK